MIKVIIYRGLPGAGKSTLAEKETHLLFEADLFFEMREGGFDSSLLPQAHAWCLRKFTEDIRELHKNSSEIVIGVANTNITVAEIAPYYAIAQAYGCDVEIKTLCIDAQTAYKRNIHDVPHRTILRMCDSMDKEERHFPRWWNYSSYHHNF